MLFRCFPISDDALLLQILKLFRVVAQQLAIDGAVVLSQLRRRLAREGLRAGQLLRCRGNMHFADDRLINLGEHPAGAGDLFIFHHAVDGVDRAGRAAGGVQDLVHLVGGVGLCPHGDDLSKALVIGYTVRRFFIEMKRLLKYNNDRIAEKLSLSRTTLWRMRKNTEPDQS